MSVFYDAGVLIAADRNQSQVWAEHRARLELGIVPITTAPVIAQVSRSPRQASLHRLLKGCETIAFDPAESHAVGKLCASARTADVVDAHLVHAAARTASQIITTDPDDLHALAAHVDASVVVTEITDPTAS